MLAAWSPQAGRHDVRNGNNVTLFSRGVYWDAVFWSRGDSERSARGAVF